jgi:acyl carrier protein
MSEQLKQIMSDVLDVRADQIGDETSQETLADWTSLAHLRLITELESEFGVQVSMDEALSLTSYAKLAAFLAKHGGGE